MNQTLCQIHHIRGRYSLISKKIKRRVVHGCFITMKILGVTQAFCESFIDCVKFVGDRVVYNRVLQQQ